MSESTHVLEASNVSFAYRGGELVLRGVDLAAAAGQFTAMLGPNGSGKTTLLRCLLGRLRPQGGRILLDAQSVDHYSSRKLARVMAYVPQRAQVSFDFRVSEIVMTGRYAHTDLLGLTGKRDEQVALEAMRMTGTEGFGARTLDELSGGEAQCVMIARALAQQPQVLLLDEPTSHLDLRNQVRIYRMMQRLAHDWPMAVVCVSHDVNVAARFADRLVLLREGKVVAAGTPGQVVRRELLEETYQVPLELIDAPGPIPLVRAR